MTIKKLISLVKNEYLVNDNIVLPEFENLQENYEIVIHIGAPKTGSSSLQKFLLENKRKLKQTGFYYPYHGLDENGISGGHSNLGLSLLKNNIKEARVILKTYLEKAKKENLTLLLSAESLFNQPEKLYEVIEGRQCKIVAFFRDPIDSIFSNYNQGVKRHFSTATFEMFCDNVLNHKVPAMSGEIFDKWSEYFKKDNLLVLGYDPVILEKMTIQEFFLRALGIDNPTVNSIKPDRETFVNKSYTSSALELKRMLNFVLDKENTKENNEIDWFLQKLSDKYTDKLVTLNFLTEEALHEKFEQTNRELKEKYLLEVNPTFLEKRPVGKQELEPYFELLTGIIEILNLIKLEDYDIFDYIIICVEESLKTSHPIFEVLTLAKWLDIPIQDRYLNDFWFDENQLNQMSNGEYKEADFLRVIANLLAKRKNYIDAEKIIQRALKLRPNGTGIIELHKMIKKSLFKSN